MWLRWIAIKSIGSSLASKVQWHADNAIRLSKYHAVSVVRNCLPMQFHVDVIKWKNFPHYWPFVWVIHRSPVNSLHKGQWRGALMFSLICARINGWVNNGEAGDLRRHQAHYDAIVMHCPFSALLIIFPFHTTAYRDVCNVNPMESTSLWHNDIKRPYTGSGSSAK